jgi:hypothetical protein
VVDYKIGNSQFNVEKEKESLRFGEALLALHHIRQMSGSGYGLKSGRCSLLRYKTWLDAALSDQPLGIYACSHICCRSQYRFQQKSMHDFLVAYHRRLSSLAVRVRSWSGWVVFGGDTDVAMCLEALAVDNGWTALVILLLGDPHLLEGRERCKDRTTNPDGVFALGRSDNLDLHRRGSECSDFLLHTIGDTWVHSGTARLEKISNRKLT